MYLNSLPHPPDYLEEDSEKDSFDDCVDSICKNMAASGFDVLSDDFLFLLQVVKWK